MDVCQIKLAANKSIVGTRLAAVELDTEIAKEKLRLVAAASVAAAAQKVQKPLIKRAS